MLSLLSLEISDPAEWNSEHVTQWLSWTTTKFRLIPKPDALKFPKTGTELCELTKADFERITGDQRSGELLAVHLAHLRHSATGHTSSSLNEKPKYKIDLEDDLECCSSGRFKGPITVIGA
ncbi:hypothetical protein RUM44_012183 [Polyplax serrata]|uniref:PNT domain-containing protein n=1 Tax=Polyplax serrata TaxID=468196 RepID=A0ABR1BAJ9_POLSC